ncbi:hypothetical protein, partial [Gluconobacter oxydans]|uniref:hypothetical protein n=2 Tax=Gluconobacter oxydans TaxID=442 RepID=UPI001E2C9C76
HGRLTGSAFSFLLSLPSAAAPYVMNVHECSEIRTLMNNPRLERSLFLFGLIENQLVASTCAVLVDVLTIR